MLEPQTQTNFGSGIKEESRPKKTYPVQNKRGSVPLKQKEEVVIVLNSGC